MSFATSFSGVFGDKRLDAKAGDMVKSLFEKGSHSIRQLSQSSAEQKSSYRFLANSRSTEASIIKGMGQRCALAVKGKTVLSIQDTTEVNLYNHKGRIRHDGSIGVTNAARNGLGFMVHPSLVVDAASCFPYGFCDVYLFNRELERQPAELRDMHGYKKLGMEEKESNKWLSSCKAAKTVLSQAAQVVIVQDREGDIYEQFATVPDGHTHLLVRAKSDRSLPEGGKLFSKIRGCEAAGSYSIQIAGDKRKKQVKRTAKLEVRFTEVVLKNSSRTAKDIAAQTTLWCVEASEAATAGKQGICWRLLTTIPITTLSEAMMIIEWYSWRWMIEEVFRILKKEGFDIEGSELGSGTAVRKLCLLTLDAVIKLFQMHIAYETDEGEGLPAGICFEQQEQECLTAQCKRLEGKTEKQKNPYPANSLRYATWVIARMGGWKGYTSERKPGITTLWIGLKKFHDTYTGYKSAK